MYYIFFVVYLINFIKGIFGFSACTSNDTEVAVLQKKIKATMIFDQGGEEPDWVTFVNVSDNEDTEFSVIVDNSLVDMNSIGTFVISYNVTDSVGNDAIQLDVVVTIITP